MSAHLTLVHSVCDPSGLGDLATVPLIPTPILRHHHCHWPSDHRFKAAARLLQSLWREDQGLAAGTIVTAEGHRRRLGSRLTFADGRAGLNFLNPAIARVAWRELVYREIGAVYDVDRLRLNLLSSQPLVFNTFALLKLDLAFATRVMAELLPGFLDEVTEVLFERAPARGNPAFTGDHTAFDVLIRGRSPAGQRAFIAIEVKYSEGMTESGGPLHGRYDELAKSTGLFVNPDEPALRSVGLQQLFRQHCLAQTMITRDLAEIGTFMFIAPRLNHLTQNAAEAYGRQLGQPKAGQVPFIPVTLDRVFEAIGAAGKLTHARALHRRYLDLWLVDGEIELAQAVTSESKPRGDKDHSSVSGEASQPLNLPAGGRS